MKTFTEANTVEQMILDAVIKRGCDPSSANWIYSSAEQVPRKFRDVMVEPWLRTLIRLYPEIVDLVDQADELLYGKHPSIRYTEELS